VTAALVDDTRAADETLAATEALGADAWTRAARHGLADPVLAEAARRCFLTAYAALSRQGVSRGLRDEVATFIERYVNRARCPADDVLDAVRV
jgi:glutamate--cysteine ligase